MSTNRRVKITQSNANVNIKVVPVNEFTKKHAKQIAIQVVKPTDCQHDILQFMDDSTSNYNFSEKPIFLQQIINKKVAKNNGEPEFGKGSSFKRQQKNNRAHIDVPTSYTITIDKAKAQRKFKTVPQEMNPNSQYMIFVRKDTGTFEAHSIENWYKINPFTKLDISSIEETERELLKKDQHHDISNKKVRDKYKIEEKEQHKSDIIYGNEIQELSDSELQEHEVLEKRKKDGLFQRIRHGNAENGESDIDDHQGDEVDYMSDESCDEDQLSEDEKEKLYDAVDVDQEIFLREENRDLSDQSDNEEEKKVDKLENNENVIDRSDNEDDDEDDDNSDDDNSDDDLSEEDVVKSKSKSDFNNNLVAASLKRPNPSSTNKELDTKRRKITNPKTDEILEEIRKHLKRKPLSAKDLFKILFKKNLVENNEESKTLFLECLERLNVKTEVYQNIKMYKL